MWPAGLTPTAVRLFLCTLSSWGQSQLIPNLETVMMDLLPSIILINELWRVDLWEVTEPGGGRAVTLELLPGLELPPPQALRWGLS